MKRTLQRDPTIETQVGPFIVRTTQINGMARETTILFECPEGAEQQTIVEHQVVEHQVVGSFAHRESSEPRTVHNFHVRHTSLALASLSRHSDPGRWLEQLGTPGTDGLVEAQ